MKSLSDSFSEKSNPVLSPGQGAATSLAILLPFLALISACEDSDGAASDVGARTTADASVTSSAGSAGETGNEATSNGTTSDSTTGDVVTGEAGAGGAPATDTGAGGVGATSSVGSSTTTGGSGGSFDDLPETDCTVSVLDAELGEIATVGIITFTADLPGIESAQIQFGRDEGYGLVAPVDLDATDYRTLLLGMTQDSTYNYRIAVSDGNQVCYGDNQTIETGSLDIEGLTEVTIGEGAPKGFVVTSRGDDIIIFDEAGELVWGYTFDGRMFSAQMSWDGQYMFGRDTGPFNSSSGGTFLRVAMDGSSAETFDAPGGDHHDFTPIPEGIAYLGKAAPEECDRVFIASDAITDGEPLFDTWEIFEYFTEEGAVGAQGERCHANRIHYIAEADVFTVSDRNKDAIAVFDRDGTPITSIGTMPSDGWTQHIQAEGAGSEWRVQHGHHLYAEDKLLVFSNNSAGGAAMLHYTIRGDSATLDWSYRGAGRSITQGDVQHLPNDTFLVTASNIGNMHLVDASQNLISSYKVGGTPISGLGYAWFRTTLYGPPPSRP